MKNHLIMIAALVLAACGNAPSGGGNSNTMAMTSSGNTSVAVSVDAAVAAANQMRAEKGLQPLGYSTRLAAIAAEHANDLAKGNLLTHKSSNGATLRDRLNDGGYKFCAAAENLAFGAPNTERTMAQWRKSPSHYQNIIHPKYREFGVARGVGDVWVMVLGTPRGRC